MRSLFYRWCLFYGHCGDSSCLCNSCDSTCRSVSLLSNQYVYGICEDTKKPQSKMDIQYNAKRKRTK